MARTKTAIRPSDPSDRKRDKHDLQKPRKTLHKFQLLKSSKSGRQPIKSGIRIPLKQSNTETDEKKKRRHSRWFRFRQRVIQAQRSVAPFLNREASFRIVKFARDRLPIAEDKKDMRFKPSAFRALHQAAEEITQQIYTDAYDITLLSGMKELQPKHVIYAIQTWSQYNDNHLASQFNKLMTELRTTPSN